MTRFGKIVFAALIVFVAIGGVVQQRILARQREQLETRGREIAGLEAEVRHARARIEEIKRAASAADQTLATEKGDMAKAETAPRRLWPSRVALLKELLTELPNQRIPELGLLTPLDWVDVARSAELDTPAKIRAALAAARAMARERFAQALQNALRRFTEQSGGELPADISRLASYLAPAGIEALGRYEMTRTGKLEGEGEYLIREKPVSDMILTVSLNNWSINNGPNTPAGPNESETEIMSRTANAIGSALAASSSEEGREMMADISQGLQGLIARMEEAQMVGDKIGDNLKAAAKQFSEAHPGDTITDLAQLLPYLQDADQLVTKARPALAYMEYLFDHLRGPADPADLQPYLNGPFDAQKALRRVKVSYDGEHVSISFSLSFSPDSK